MPGTPYGAGCGDSTLRVCIAEFGRKYRFSPASQSLFSVLPAGSLSQNRRFYWVFSLPFCFFKCRPIDKQPHFRASIQSPLGLNLDYWASIY
jgi:hypothetical protein